ncbi:MAG: RsmE family RNA methyltransferase [Candidatus Methylomirabilales bacterium]
MSGAPAVVRRPAKTRGHSPFFYTDPHLIEDTAVGLEGADARHLSVVRRGRVGDRILVSDGLGKVFEVEVVSVDPERVRGEILSSASVPQARPCIAVFQALAKGEKVDLAIRKLVEVGVDEIVVYLAGRSVPRWDLAKASQALHRWETIAREAAKQARRAWLPRVRGPLVLEDAAGAVEGWPCLLADPGASQPLHSALRSLSDPPSNSLSKGGQAPERMALVVGPEGGLAPEEAAAFAGRGATLVSLGEQILRTETAGLVGAAVVMYHFGRLG